MCLETEERKNAAANASTSTQAKTPGTAKKKTVSKLPALRAAGNTKQIIKHENQYVHGEY